MTHDEIVKILLYSLPPFIVGLLTVRFTKLPLKWYQGIYLLLGVVWLSLHFLYLPDVSLLKPVLCLVAGEIAHFIIIGATNNKMSAVNVSSVLMGVGLFPWYISSVTSVVYILSALFISGVWSFIKFKLAARKYGVTKTMKVDAVQAKISDGDFAKFYDEAKTILALPILAGGILAFIITQPIFS